MTTFEIVIVCLLAVAFASIAGLCHLLSKILDILEMQGDNLDKCLKCIQILKGIIK